MDCHTTTVPFLMDFMFLLGKSIPKKIKWLYEPI